MHRPLLFALVAFIAVMGGSYAAASSGGISAKAGDQRSRIVCRRFLRTGSLADSYRTCKTVAEWDREHENLQRLDNPNSCSNPNGNGCDPH